MDQRLPGSLIRFGRGGAGIAALLMLVGCAQHELGVSHPLDYTDDQIQSVVERKLDQQKDESDGVALWDQVQADEFQDDATVQRDRRRVELERRRSSRARRIVDGGPLRLEQALTIALELNDEVLAAREETRAVGGEEMMVQSRFLPTLTYVLDTEILVPNDGDQVDDTDNTLRAEMTLFEFGKDNPEDVALRAEQRDALFDYEDVVSRVLSDVRLQFFTVLLRQDQADIRRDLLLRFKDLERDIQEKVRVGRAVKTDALTAALNVLNEESRINSLDREINRRRIDLLHVIGLPAGMADFRIDGEPEDEFGMEVDEAVEIALRRSTAIAQSRAVVYEQARVVQQVWWEDGPTFAGQVGWRDSNTRAGIDLESDDGTHSVSAFTEGGFDLDPGAMEDFSDRLTPDEEGFFAALNMELPLFTGFEHEGRVLRERSRLAAARHELRNTTDLVELDVRKLYETVEQRRAEVRFQDRTVTIEGERFEIQQKRKEMDLITDDQLETFRNRYLDAQDTLLGDQIRVIEAIEALRAAMRYFNPAPVNQGGIEP